MTTHPLPFAFARGKLTGILTLPDGSPKVLAVLVGGSGPVTSGGITDKEVITGVQPPFEVWSGILAGVRVATFRYNKRAAAYAKEYRLGHLICRGIDDEYIDDLADACTMLRRHPEVGNIPRILIGHSLGGIAALVFAALTGEIQGVVTIGAPIFDLVSSLSEQLARQGMKAQQSQLLNTLKTPTETDKTKWVFGVPHSYWQSYSSLKLEDLLRARRGSLLVLVVHGDRDKLIPAEQFQPVLGRVCGGKGINCKKVAGDHFLMIRKPSGRGDSGEYNFQIVVDWIESNWAGR